MKPMALVYRLFKIGALITLTAMIVVVGLQVFTRLFMASAPHWTEEAARIFFIYSVAFGTGIGIKNGDFIRLNLIGKYLSPGFDRLLDILTESVIILFSIVLTVHSVQFVKLGMDELSPALKLTMGFVFISIALIGLAIAVFTAEKLYDLIKEKTK